MRSVNERSKECARRRMNGSDVTTARLWFISQPSPVNEYFLSQCDGQRVVDLGDVQVDVNNNI